MEFLLVIVLIEFAMGSIFSQCDTNCCRRIFINAEILECINYLAHYAATLAIEMTSVLVNSL